MQALILVGPPLGSQEKSIFLTKILHKVILACVFRPKPHV